MTWKHELSCLYRIDEHGIELVATQENGILKRVEKQYQVWKYRTKLEFNGTDTATEYATGYWY